MYYFCILHKICNIVNRTHMRFIQYVRKYHLLQNSFSNVSHFFPDWLCAFGWLCERKYVEKPITSYFCLTNWNNTLVNNFKICNTSWIMGSGEGETNFSKKRIQILNHSRARWSQWWLLVNAKKTRRNKRKEVGVVISKREFKESDFNPPFLSQIQTLMKIGNPANSI